MIRFFLIGLLMGGADLVPGVSGGTIAYICGVYEQLLEAIKSLQINKLKEIKWRFILPLGGGILTSVFSLAHLFHFLLAHPTYHAYLLAAFFGVIVAALFFCMRKEPPKAPLHWGCLLGGALFSFWLAGNFSIDTESMHWAWLIVCGMLASSAMLLPGISGSFVLHLLGVYGAVLLALTRADLSVLAPLMLGVALGLSLFSRVISFLLRVARPTMISLLTGFMVGGLRSLYPFSQESIPLLVSVAFVSASLVFAIELVSLKLKRNHI